MKHREKEWGPFTFLTSTAGTRRRFPWVGRNRVTPSNGLSYTVGMWVSWLGREVSVCRNRWVSEKATWRNQATCAMRGGHRPITVTGELGAYAEHGEPGDPGTLFVPQRVECDRCGRILEGARWVPVP